MIAGQYPRRIWRDNPGGETRTMEEAVEIAKRYGVVIPDDIELHVDESGRLNKDFLACSPRSTKRSGDKLLWSDLVHDRTNKVPFQIWQGVLKSDEAILAVLAHEMFEIHFLRPFLERGELSIDEFILHTEPGRPGNLHDKAWDAADQMVDKMRGVLPQ